MEEYTEAARIAALAAHLNLELWLEADETPADLITPDSHTDNAFEAEGGTYLVLTDEEADEAVRTYIEESIWAFNPDFLAGNTGLPESVFRALQNESEDANAPILAIVTKCGNFDQLVRDAVMSDGRGHFLSQYDGEENEEGDFFIFRTN